MYKKYKCDIWCIIVLIITFALISSYNASITDLRYWMIVAGIYAAIIIMFIDGKRKGQQQAIADLLHKDIDVAITDLEQKVYKLKDIKNGIFFSVVNETNEIKEPLDKYLKLTNQYGTTHCGAYNMTQRKGEILSGDSNVILYSCRAIYTPKIEIKEEQ